MDPIKWKCKYSIVYFKRFDNFDLVYFTTRVPDTSNTIVALATRVRHEWDTRDTSATLVRDGCYTNDTSEKFSFCNDMSKNIFLHSYIYYKTSERLYGEEQFHSKNYFLEMSLLHAKMRFKSELFNGKSYIKKLYTRL